MSLADQWFAGKGWSAFPFQRKVWRLYLEGESGLLNAPTGSGKTYAMWIPCVLDYIRAHPTDYSTRKPEPLMVVWITPLRALAHDIRHALQQFCDDMQVPWDVAVRTGDITSAERQRQTKRLPQCLVTTPESLHVMLSRKNAAAQFTNVQTVIVDEWHEILSTKRGVQVELVLSYIKNRIQNPLRIWGVSATIGNLDEALEVLLGSGSHKNKHIVRAEIEKRIEVQSVIPEEIEKFPWAGHLGVKLLPQVLPIIRQSRTTLLFTNTRSQTEIWYREILNQAPDMAGAMAMHHGSLEPQIRTWVEQMLHLGKLKLVVCTSSLDLGVDFRPVEVIIQVGGPKGVSRFMQRAGRSGHQPGALSRIFFVPSHALELIEGAALRSAIARNIHESRVPLRNSLDVLLQYLVTLAVGDGFSKEPLLAEVRSTFAYAHLSDEEWRWAMQFITTGGDSLAGYDEYQKVVEKDGVYVVENRRISMRHRMSIGTIVGDPVLQVKYVTGGYIGTVEESFISQLKPGDVFWFAGRSLEFVRLKDLTAQVVKSNKKNGKIPAWMGGRLPLSSKLAELIREKLDETRRGIYADAETQALQGLLELQRRWSEIPGKNTLLIEYIQSREGHHIYFYPFQGRFVHEVLAALVAYRIGRLQPMSFSIAMNDYGFELLSDQPIPIEDALEQDLFSKENLVSDMEISINKSAMAKRKFRDIATISGLIFKGYPGKHISNKHLQASSGLIYEVFEQYDPGNLLLHQAKDEVISLQLDYGRLMHTLDLINSQQLVLTKPKRFTPFCFPIMADRLREKLSTEKLADRIRRIQDQLNKAAS